MDKKTTTNPVSIDNLRFKMKHHSPLFICLHSNEACCWMYCQDR